MARRPMLFSTLVFLDLETTGLPSSTFKPEITELCMIAANRVSMEQSKFPPRVLNKMNLCFYPTRTTQVVAERISGLSKDALCRQKDFDNTAIQLMLYFLKRLDSPVCLIAHNGLGFDFPLLRAYLAAFQDVPVPLLDCHGNSVYCADTRRMFRALNSRLVGDENSLKTQDFGSTDMGPKSKVSKPTPKKDTSKSNSSFSLGDVYLRAFGRNHVDAHTAEGDCLAVMEIVQFLGFSAMDWIQANHIDFNEIQPTFKLPVVHSSPVNDFPYAR